MVLFSGIPFALVPLRWLTGRRDLMGGWVDRRATTGCVVAALPVGLVAADLLLAVVLP